MYSGPAAEPGAEGRRLGARRGALHCAACVTAAAFAGLSGVPGVSAATVAVTSAPNDTAFRNHQQWGLVQAGFPAAWCRSTGAGALIVVLDTGIDASHPDLAGKLVGQARVQNGLVTTGAGAALDDSGHGTHVAGIAAAATGNGLGIAGAAPGAHVYAIKVLFAPAPGQPEQGTQSDLVQAIDYAADTIAPSWAGPVVLNISIGAADAQADSGTLSDTSGSGTGAADVGAALEHAYGRGLAVALAAGNTGTSVVGGSAVADGAALSVGALDQNGAVAPYSPSAGASIFAAGGSAGGDHRYISTGILSTWPHSSSGDYAWMAGTSMASPHVAAALAMLMSTGLSNEQAYAQLQGTADAQRRMHVDLALGSTTPCGLPAPAPAAVRRVGRAVPAARVVVPTPAPAPAATPSPVVGSVRPLSTAPPAALAVSSGRPLGWATRIALGIGAALLFALMVPRRLVVRLLRR